MATVRACFAIVAGALWLGLGCAGEAREASPPPPGDVCGAAYLADVESSFWLDVSTHAAGASPEIIFDMYIPGSAPDGKILLTRTIVITLPAEFGFAGFDALGPGAEIGSWDFDFSQPNGVWDPLGPLGYDYRIPHYAIDFASAYADTLLNGSYDAGVDSVVAYSLVSGMSIFVITLPSGGTDNNGLDPDNPCSYFDTDTRFTLPAGIVWLPQTPGSYDVSIVATSVDPDTGDADDEQGTPPAVYQRTVPVQVPEPAAGSAVAALALAVLRRRARPTR